MAALAETVPPLILVVNSAKGLRNADFLGKSDPYCRVSCAAFNICTPVVKNNLNPSWEQAILVCLPASLPPTLNLTVFDSDAGAIVDGSDDFLGSAELNLAEVLAPHGWSHAELPLTGDKKSKGFVTVSVHPYVETTLTIDRCNGLRNADGMFGKSDPYGIVQGGGGQTWGQTRVIKNDLNPVFGESFGVNLLDRLPMGGKLDPVRVKFMDSDNGVFSGSDDPLGEAVLAWSQLFPGGGKESHTIPLTGKKAKGTAVITVATKDIAPAAGGAAASASAAAPVTKVPKAAVQAVLTKGLGMKIADCSDEVVDMFTLGLAWDVTDGVNIDLDASCIVLDAQLQQVDLVFFNHLTSTDGAIQHGGDEREGDEKGDDESITVDLGKLSPNAQYLGFVINSYSGQELNDVHRASCRLYETATQRVVGSYDLSSDTGLDCTAFLMCVLYKRGNDWFMHAIGEGAAGRTAADNVDELQAFLTKHPLASSTSVVPPPQMALIKAPATLGAQRKIAIPLPSGGHEQVTLPPDTKPNDMIEVPIITMFS